MQPHVGAAQHRRDAHLRRLQQIQRDRGSRRQNLEAVRRIPAGNGVYNLGVSPDGSLLVATNKRDASVSIFSTGTAKELARLPTKRKVLHGVAITPDSRYAFITVEGVGSEPGTVEIIDLKSLTTVATVDTPSQAAGIDFWKMD